MSNSLGFQFKQFFIAHDRCAMKVNTDGVLLGAIADVQNAKRVLDLGTGTGLIAIMLAQRTASDCQIVALELEANAAMQAKKNVQQSPWSERICVLNQDVLQFRTETKFDLVVANPPYFSNSLASRSDERTLARSAVQPHLMWLKKAKECLALGGEIWWILPIEEGQKLIACSHEIGLYCTQLWKIHTQADRPPKRWVMVFAMADNPIVANPIVQNVDFARSTTPNCYAQYQLNIYQSNGKYSEDFIALTKSFYLKM